MLYSQLSIAQNRLDCCDSMLPARPKLVANSSFLSATPSALVSVYFHTSSALVSIVRIALAPNGVTNRGKHELVDEDGVALVDTVVVAIFVHGDPADRRDQIDPLWRLHVAAQLDDEHPAVAVEGNLCGILDDRIGQHRLRRYPGGSQNRFACSAGASASTGGLGDRSAFALAGSAAWGAAPGPGPPPGVWIAPRPVCAYRTNPIGERSAVLTVSTRATVSARPEPRTTSFGMDLSGATMESSYRLPQTSRELSRPGASAFCLLPFAFSFVPFQ